MSVSSNVNTFKCYIYRSKPRRMFSHSPNTRTFPMHIQPLLVLKGSKKITRENNENRPFVSTLANRTRSNRRYRPVRDVLFHRMRANNTKKKCKKSRRTFVLYSGSATNFCCVMCLSFFLQRKKRTSEARAKFPSLTSRQWSRKREKTKKIKSSLTSLCFRCDAYYVSTAHT
jgi:hypothetical protein